MTVKQAIAEAIELLESAGFKGGDIHDNLGLILTTLPAQALNTKLPELPQ